MVKTKGEQIKKERETASLKKGKVRVTVTVEGRPSDLRSLESKKTKPRVRVVHR